MSSIFEALSQTSAATASNPAQQNDKSTLGKEDFLKLLVAQMKYQDPLNPDDPTEFTAQLSQYSQLEQLFNISGGMEDLISSFQNSDRLTALNTIGREIAFQGDDFSYQGGTVTLGYQLEDQATDVSIAIRQGDRTVAVLDGTELDEGTHYLSWDGRTTDGDTAEAGEYSIVIEARGSDGKNLETHPLIRSTVTGADLDGTNGGTLITSAGTIDFSDVLGVFEKAKENTSEGNSST